MTDLILKQLADVIETRRPEAGGDAQTSYVARLLAKAPDAVLKKIGEEATELVMAVKDAQHGADQSAQRQVNEQHVIAECADLWFHCLIALAQQGLRPEAVLAELARRAGTSGIEEKAARKVKAREQDEQGKDQPLGDASA